MSLHNAQRALAASLLSLMITISQPAFATPTPDRLNPSVTQATIQQTICVAGYTATVRPPSRYTNAIKKTLLTRAGIPLNAIRDYELDHIIPLAIGGSPANPRNLMLQPWKGESGAHRKDRLEVKLQCLVCSGQLPLSQAQNEIVDDWQSAYHRHALTKCRRPKRLSRHPFAAKPANRPR